MIREDVCIAGNVLELVQVLRAEKPALRWSFFWDSHAAPLSCPLKASYLWTASHACNHNRMHYGKEHVQPKISYLTSFCQSIKTVTLKRSAPLEIPFISLWRCAEGMNRWICTWPSLLRWECLSLSIHLCFACYFCVFCPILCSICLEPGPLTPRKCPHPLLPQYHVLSQSRLES
jgi:hypothetical protein